MDSGKGVTVGAGVGVGSGMVAPDGERYTVKKKDYELKKLQIIEPNKENSITVIFLKFIIHFTGGQSDYLPRAPKILDASLGNSTRTETVRELENTW